MTRRNINPPGRTKSTLPLTRTAFVPPKRLGTQAKTKVPSSSLTPVKDENEEGDEDDEARKEQEEEQKQDAVSEGNQSKMINTEVLEPSEGFEPVISRDQAIEPRSSNLKTHPNVPQDAESILKSIQGLTQDHSRFQKQFEEFKTKATTMIKKLEQSTAATTQHQDEDYQQHLKSLRELKALIAESPVPAKAAELAEPFVAFQERQVPIQSRLNRFTQLDSEESSASLLSQTVDPNLLRPSHQIVDIGISPLISPDPGSSLVVSSSLPEAPRDDQGVLPRTDTEHGSPLPDYGPDLVDVVRNSSPLFLPSRSPSPSQPSHSVAAAPDLMSIAGSVYHNSNSSASPIPLETHFNHPSPPVSLTQPIQLTQPTQSVEAIDKSATRAVEIAGSKKRPRRRANLNLQSSSSHPSPPPKRQKGQKTAPKHPIKPKLKKRQSKGESGSLPIGTLGRSSGIKRVQGADWPKIGPNTVIGLAGNIECEQCLGAVHRSCAGLMDNEETPDLAWICPDCDFIREHGGTKLPVVSDPDSCIRPNCIRRKNAKIEWKPADSELYIIKEAIGRRPLKPERGWSNGKYEYLTSWHGYPLNESTWEPIESFVTAQEMVRDFNRSATAEGADTDEHPDAVILEGGDGILQRKW